MEYYNENRIYLWQVEKMPDDPLYSKMNIQEDYQFAIDQKDIERFVADLEHLEESESITFVCYNLPIGQPHSCDNQDEIWGKPRTIIKYLTVERSSSNIGLGLVKSNTAQELILSFGQVVIKNFIDALNKASSASVFFEYEHFIELKNHNGKLNKFNIWGWCKDGQVEYAN
jgi:hypothetical protein